MAEDIRLAKGEEVDVLKAEVAKKVNKSTLENDGYLKKKIVGVLPSRTAEFDYADSKSLFLASSRCTAEMAEDVDGNKYEKITSASNAANKYAFAYFDISKYTDGAKQVVIEFDTLIKGDRWYIGLSDLVFRPAESNRGSYETTGVIISQGTKDGNYYYVNTDLTWKNTFFNCWVHSKYIINFDTKKVSYIISNSTPSDTLSDTLDFMDTTVDKVTGIEIYSYVNDVEMGIDNIKITGIYSEEQDERTIYIVPENGAFDEYLYIDSKPVCIGRSDIVGVINNLLERVEKLENT